MNGHSWRVGALYLLAGVEDRPARGLFFVPSTTARLGAVARRLSGRDAMFLTRLLLAAWFVSVGVAAVAQGRVWTEATGQYTLEAELVAFDGKTVVLQRADHELVAIPVEKLSTEDRQYLESGDAGRALAEAEKGLQTWTLADGTQVTGRLVDYTQRDVTLQRRRGRIYVNDRPLDNLPEFYQQLLPKIVAKLEGLRRDDRRGLESWLVRQRGQARTFRLEGVLLEMENGDEYGVPFFMFSEEDQRLFRARWNEWLKAHREEDYRSLEDHAFLLRSLAAARHRDKMVQREIALMHLNLQAVEAGVTSLWEVTLYPAAGQPGPPLWVVVPARDSRQATATALKQHPGYVAGPIRRVSRR